MGASSIITPGLTSLFGRTCRCAFDWRSNFCSQMERYKSLQAIPEIQRSENDQLPIVCICRLSFNFIYFLLFTLYQSNSYTFYFLLFYFTPTKFIDFLFSFLHKKFSFHFYLILYLHKFHILLLKVILTNINKHFNKQIVVNISINKFCMENFWNFNFFFNFNFLFSFIFSLKIYEKQIKFSV